MSQESDAERPVSLSERARLHLVGYWRSWVTTGAVLSCGVLIGLAAGRHHSSFMRAWVGAALATPLAFLAGLLCPPARQSPRHGKSRLASATLGMILGCGVAASAWFFVLPLMRTETASLAMISGLKPGTIRCIWVRSARPTGKRWQMKDAAKLDAFASALRDANGYYPNHPTFVRSWHLTIETKGAARISLDCHYQAGRPDEVVFSFQGGGAYYGTGISRGLREWFGRCIEGLEADEVQPADGTSSSA